MALLFIAAFLAFSVALASVVPVVPVFSVVVLVLPPGVKGGRMKSNFAAVVHPAVRQVAADCGVELIEPDLFASKEMYQADNVHLSREGASCLAQAVASCLLQTQDNISTT